MAFNLQNLTLHFYSFAKISLDVVPSFCVMTDINCKIVMLEPTALEPHCLNNFNLGFNHLVKSQTLGSKHQQRRCLEENFASVANCKAAIIPYLRHRIIAPSAIFIVRRKCCQFYQFMTQQRRASAHITLHFQHKEKTSSNSCFDTS